MNPDTNRGYAIIHPDDVADSYADSKVPGEFRRLTDALDGDQLAVTLIPIPGHYDFEQGTGYHHERSRRSTSSPRDADDALLRGIETVRAPAAVRVARATIRSHRNEQDEDIDMWAISRQLGWSDSTTIDEFWGGLASRAPYAR